VSEKELCKHGGCENVAAELHACPYKEEVFDDKTTLCNCCDACAYECAMDI
jgi:hypothetical protein